MATNGDLTSARYSEMQSGSDSEINFCITPGEQVYMVVLAAPTQYQKMTWDSVSDGKVYPSIYRYPYMVEVQGAWPQGFQNGQLAACPSGTVRHSNGGGCALASTPSSVYVGPYAKVLGSNVSGNARIEDQASIINGTVSGGTVGALSLIGVASQPLLYPMGWFGNNQTASSTAVLLGDLEFVTGQKSSNTFYGFVAAAFYVACML